MNKVKLRRPVRDDGPELVKLHVGSRNYHLPWVEPFIDETGFSTWFEHKMTGKHVAFLAIDADTDGIVGVVNINEIIGGAFQNAFLGYYGMDSYAGKGLMTEAVRLAVRFAFDELGLHRLEANIQPGNAKSIALVKRLGFRFEGYSPDYLKIGGEWRDHERWAILAEARAKM